MIGVELEYPDFRQAGKNLSRVNPMLRKIEQYRRNEFKRLIDRGRDPYGKPYARLKRRYSIRKVRRWGNRVILTASGKMKRTHDTQIIGGGLAEYVDSPAQHHQSGTRNMPQRLVLPLASRGLPKRDSREIGKIARKFYTQSMKTKTVVLRLRA